MDVSTSKRSLTRILVAIALTISCLSPVASAAIPFNASSWQGNAWCYNNNNGAWFPTVSTDGATATFKDSTGDYCWNEIRTISYAQPLQTYQFTVKPFLNSGGTNRDEAYFGFGPTWISCCATDVRSDGWFSGIGFWDGKIWIVANSGYPNWVTAEQIGTYQPGNTVNVQLTVVTGGVQVSVGTVTKFVAWVGQNDQTPKRFLAVEANSASGIELGAVTVTSGQDYASGPVNYSDMWWVTSESGWGAGIHQQADVIFVTLYVYGPDGKPAWFSSAAHEQPGGDVVFIGDLYATTGPYFIGPFDPTRVTRTKVGTLSFHPDVAGPTFSYNGLLTYTVNGASVTKNVTRQTWTYQNIAGDYVGAFSMKQWGCNDSSANGTFSGTGQVRLTHSAATNAVTMTVSNVSTIGSTAPPTSSTCSGSGSYSQFGHMGHVTGSGNCLFGAPGAITFTFFEIERTYRGIAGRFQTKSADNCLTDGSFGWVLR